MQYTTTVKRRTIDKHALTMYKVSIKVDVLIIVSYRIKEIVMTPAYENNFIHGYTILLFNFYLTQLRKIAVSMLTISALEITNH